MSEILHSSTELLLISDCGKGKRKDQEEKG